MSAARVTVVVAALDLPQVELARHWRNLSAEERARAAAFHNETSRARFIAAHGVLRAELAAVLACAPRSLVFTTDAFGKPYLAEDGRPHGLRFNISHSGGLMALALSESCEIGIDIECPGAHAARDIDAMIGHICAPAERAALRSLPGQNRIAAFYRLWTRKEALLKAMGRGFQFDPARLDVTHAPENWSLRDLDLGPGLFAALAAQGGEIALTAAFGGMDHADMGRYSPAPFASPGWFDRAKFI